MNSLERALLWVVRFAFAALLFFTPLIISKSFFFPFITGKNFFFRIVVELIFCSWLALAFLSPTYRLRRSTLLVAVFAFLGSLIIATLLGAEPYHSFWSNFERMEGLITYLHLVALFVAVAHTIKTDREWFWLVSVSLIGSFFVGLYGTCEHFMYNTDTNATALEKFCTNGSGGGRIYATFGNFIYLAVYALFHIFAGLMLFSSTKDVRLRIAIGAVTIFNLYIFILAGSRGATVGLLAGIFVMALAFLILARTRVFRLIGAGILLLLLAFPFILHAFADSAFVRHDILLSRLASFSLEHIQDQPRVKIWKIGIEAVKERPIFGWGPENFIIPYAKYYDPTLFGNEPWFDRVHNMSLEWLVDVGLVGFLAYIILLCVIGWSIYLLIKTGRLSLQVGVLIVGILVAYIVQNLFVFDTITNYIFFFVILAFLHSRMTSTEARSHKYRQRALSPAQTVGLACIAALTFSLVIGLNIEPMFAASDLLNALSVTSTAKTSDDIINAFNKTFERDTFGITEARERYANFIVDISTSSIDPQIALPILDASVKELEKEFNEHPKVAKYPIFLGKLYTVRENWVGEGKDKAEYFYTKAKDLAPHYPQIDLGLAELYLATGEGEKATQLIDRAFELSGQSGAMFQATLSTHVLAYDFVGAEQLLKYIQSGSGYAITQDDMSLLISRVLRKPKNLEDRLSFLQALDILYDSVYVDIGLAQTYGETGNKQLAREFAEKARKADPQFSQQVDSFLKSLEDIP